MSGQPAQGESSFNLAAEAEKVLAIEEGGARAAFVKGYTKNQRQKLKAYIAANPPKATQTQEKGEFSNPEDDDSDFDIPNFTPKTSVKSKSVISGNRTENADLSKVTISDEEIQAMWASIDVFDVSTISPDDIRIFEYEGFNPDEILRAMMKQQKVNSIGQAEFLRDVSVLCGLAIVKGNVNDNNFKKMKKEGQDAFLKLQARYGIKMGSAKGLSSDVITVARIAAAFPGIVIRLLHEGKVTARDFSGPMKSAKLPGVSRHQALAACIPRDLDDDTKSFLLSAVVAFSVDQSLVITSGKQEIETVIRSQTNFIKVAHSGKYPREEVRKAIFKSFVWQDHFEGMSTAVKELSKKDENVKVIDLPTLKAAVNKL